MKRLSVLNNKTGMTFVEVIVSIAIVAMLALFALSLFGVSIATTLKSGRQTTALNISEGHADNLLSGAMTPVNVTSQIDTTINNKTFTTTITKTIATHCIYFNAQVGYTQYITGTKAVIKTQQTDSSSTLEVFCP